ncbi:MAG: sulfite exporter TauE/SafE family protein [Pseudomonadota bacterium]
MYTAMDPSAFILGIIFLFGGLIRGFAGFGTALVVMPLGAIFLPAPTVLVTMLVADTFPTIPLVLRAYKKVIFSSLIVIYIGYLCAFPLGIWILFNTDPSNLRWFVCVVVFLACALLWSGWKYRGPRNAMVRAIVGGMAGTLGGSTGMNGPPVILYWLAQENKADQIRANLIVLFALTTIAGFAFFWWNEVLTTDRIVLGLAVSPAYFIGIEIGSRFFKGASDEQYRTVALLLILAAAVIAMPLWDRVFMV